MGCFIVGVIAYDIAVYQMTTDYEFILEDYEALAHQEMLQNIASSQGLEAAHQAMNQFAKTTEQSIQQFTFHGELPDLVRSHFVSSLTPAILYDEDRILWFRLAGSELLYRYIPNEGSLVRQKVELEDNIVWVFFVSSFILYSLGHLLIIFRRVKKLESVTLSFAKGDLSSRAETSSSSAIGTLNRSFNHMADRIQSLIDSNRSLTNAVAHELRTPVFRIQWQAELLKETELNAQQRETVESIVEDTEEMEAMVDELLCYAKLDSERHKIAKADVNIGAVVSKNLHRWRKETALTLNISSLDSASNANVLGDEKLLRRALDNVVRNAMKYAESTIEIDVETEASNVVVSIHDDGPGVEEEHVAQLFEPFYVGSKARNKAKSGHGLGLSIVQKVCHQHDGAVKVARSERLQGAVFIITIPLCNELTDNSIQ
tara:strand:- start:2371 stop:3660 length:1290 start_codon:yes stop_codon:yes gene_type:complete